MPPSAPRSPFAPSAPTGRRRRAIATSAAVLVLLGGLLALGWARPDTAPPPVGRAELAAPSDAGRAVAVLPVLHRSIEHTSPRPGLDAWRGAAAGLVVALAVVATLASTAGDRPRSALRARRHQGRAPPAG